ncbi:hypothetical protein HYFRA_00002082 [Hymenoscyphus fraxineus]|uniref:Uncharacterized protein n=1 Tax=Hymenoscyphus fraxineus TaxID=746836 RepID=A0A9N9KKJ8_9HELO|nr:hypothetical protein HYFRA_00002082 [Hymenoscyphus fraxineus]
MSSSTQQTQHQTQQPLPQQQQQNQQMTTQRAEGYREGPIRESRIKDRPYRPDQDSSVKIKIELDLEVEVDLYARVKGDVTIGLM